MTTKNIRAPPHEKINGYNKSGRWERVTAGQRELMCRVTVAGKLLPDATRALMFDRKTWQKEAGIASLHTSNRFLSMSGEHATFQQKHWERRCFRFVFFVFFRFLI